MNKSSELEIAESLVSVRGSASVAALEKAWEALRTLEPAIPTAVLTFVDVRSRRRLKGYFANSIWKKLDGSAHEIGINPNLMGDSCAIVATMMHEAAHAVLHEFGENGGMGATRYYHTRKFRDQCVCFGLDCDFLNCRYGWTLTSWPESGIPERYQSVLDRLDASLPPGTVVTVPKNVKGRGLPPPGHTVMACDCDSGRRTIYVNKSVLQAGGISCAFCKGEFRHRCGSI